MMKHKARKMMMMVLAVFIVLPMQAQLFNQFKTDDAAISFIQFPTQKERKRKLTYEMAMESIASKAVKNEAVSNMLTKGISIGQGPELPEIDLIPHIFPTDGDLYAEIIYSPSIKGEDFLNMKRVVYNYLKGGTHVEVIAAYKVYSMPGKKLIYEQDKRMVEGYVKGSSSSTSSMSGSGVATAADQEAIARRWALDQIRDRYSIRSKYHSFPVYRIKKLEGDVEDRAKEVQEKYVTLLAQWDGKNQSADFQEEVKECMNHWEGLLKQHKPGTKKQNEALITDNNVWCLQHNLAMGHMILGQKEKALSLINKAVQIRTPKEKEFKNEDGETKGKVSGIQNNEDQAFLAESKRVVEHYFEGLNNMNSAFVELVYHPDKIRKASRLALQTAGNLYTSSLYDIEAPVPFASPSIDGDPKLIKGNVGDVNFSIKKQLLYFLTKAYTMNMNGNGIAYKEKLSHFLPASQGHCGLSCSNYIGDEKNEIYFVSRLSYKKAKDAQKNKYEGYASFQYDYNGDILIENNKLNDNGLFMFFMNIKPGEALGLRRDQIRVKHDNFEVQSLTVDTEDIERERDVTFFSAFLKKKFMSPSTLLETAEISNDETRSKYEYSGDQLKITQGGNTQSGRMTLKKDDKGNWTLYKVNGVEAKRSFQYE